MKARKSPVTAQPLKKRSPKNHFLPALAPPERLHRCLLEFIKFELDGQANEQRVKSVQALSLYKIGDGKLSATELSCPEKKRNPL
jgi:hypothetical protein